MVLSGQREATCVWSTALARLGTNKGLCSPQGINPASLTSTTLVKQISRWMYQKNMRGKTNQTYKTAWSPATIFLWKKNLIPVSFSQRTFFSLSVGVKQHLIDLFRNIIDSDDSGRTQPSKTAVCWHIMVLILGAWLQLLFGSRVAVGSSVIRGKGKASPETAAPLAWAKLLPDSIFHSDCHRDHGWLRGIPVKLIYWQKYGLSRHNSHCLLLLPASTW